MTTRKIKKLTTGQRTIDGAGVHLVRVLGHDTVMDYDPFLMLDSFDSHNPTDYIKGFPIHPHRGIETISYLVQGEMTHQDSLGNNPQRRKPMDDCRQWYHAPGNAPGQQTYAWRTALAEPAPKRKND